MKLIEDLNFYHEKSPKVLSLGMFDGVHLGHISIINQLKDKAKKNNLETSLLTFWPHPRKIFNPNDQNICEFHEIIGFGAKSSPFAPGLQTPIFP